MQPLLLYTDPMNVSDLETDTVDGILKRLRRIEGQVRGLQKMVEDGRDCEDLLTQMTAAKKAMDSASTLVLQEFLSICASDLSKGNRQKPAQIADMLRKFAG